MAEHFARAAQVVRDYARGLRDAEQHRSGPRKGRCDPDIEKELAEYAELAKALDAAAWTPVAKDLPDDDVSVMIALNGEHGEPVWVGFHDADGWHSATDGAPLGDMVTHWKDIEAGPHG